MKMNKEQRPGIEIFQKVLRACEKIVNTLGKNYPHDTIDDEVAFTSGIVQGFMEAARMFCVTTENSFKMYQKVLQIYNKEDAYKMIQKDLETATNQKENENE